MSKPEYGEPWTIVKNEYGKIRIITDGGNFAFELIRVYFPPESLPNGFQHMTIEERDAIAKKIVYCVNKMAGGE